MELKLSNKYKIYPYNWFSDQQAIQNKAKRLSPKEKNVYTRQIDEQEERVLKEEIPNFSDYVIKLQLYRTKFNAYWFDTYSNSNKTYKDFAYTIDEFAEKIKPLVPYEVEVI